jgi:predicted permease
MNWRRLIKSAQADAELRKELESCIEITTEEYIAQGMGVSEARQAARRKLGSLTRIQEEVYEMNTATFVEGAMRVLRYAARMLRQNPAFSLTAILTLALGIGATTAMFSVVNGVITIQTVRPAMPPSVIADPDRLVRLEAQMLEQLAAIPGVTSAAYVDSLPMDRGGGVIVAAKDKTYAADELPPTRSIKMISPGYFRTLGTRLVAGRDVDRAELYSERNVALVSETFARQTWNTVAGALGKRIKVGTTGDWQEVIGVVADIHDDGADRPAPAIVYWPARQHQMIGSTSPVSVAFTLRSNRTATEGFLSDIRQAVAAVDPNLPLASVNTVAAMYDLSMARTSFSLVLLVIAGAMALLLGIVGIYGVLSYAVMQRQREVGIRLALGAQPHAVKQMFVYRGMIVSGVGIAVGAAAAAGLTRLMSSLLFGVTPIDAATFGTAAAVLVIAALIASYVPARRAAAVDPVETLRRQ